MEGPLQANPGPGHPSAKSYLTKEEPIYTASPPPWGVPNRRKPRGMGRDCIRLYDPDEGCLFLSRGSEITTQNRYSPLMNCPIDYECEVLRKGPLQDFGPNHHRGFSRRGMHENLHESPREDSACSFCFNNNHDNLVYKNKINFCSGYFPDYILYPYVDIDKVEPDLRLMLNYYPTFYIYHIYVILCTHRA